MLLNSSEISFIRRRVTFLSSKSTQRANPVIRMRLNGNQNIIEFKALAKRSGLTRNYEVKVGLLGTHSTIGQAAQSVISAAIPGNMSPIRSPIRSGLWGAITPGKPRIPGGTGGTNRTHRCPEGYQYGGRFTDSRYSSCGQKLFDIPSPLGAVIGALRRIARGARAVTAGASTPITGEPTPESTVQSRRPQIPRVGNPNPAAKASAAKNTVSQMGQISEPITRMVRRDGFVLEPVVPAQVLRAIPDNRDMEGADFILTVQDLPQLGGQELGLLSNTGVTKLTYVLPGGSTLSLEKKRQLTIGERRKLGRTVNSAAKIDISKDPTARLKEVVLQTGDGIGYSENFTNIKNPNDVVSKPGGKAIPKWADELFGKGRKAKPKTNADRETDSDSAVGKEITSISEAIEHITAGRSLADIDPAILQQAITKANVFKKQKLDNRREILETPSKSRFTLYTPTMKYEHIGQKFASDMQQHLGLDSPDVFFVGTGEKRKYLVEDPSTLIRGFNVDRKKTMSDYKPQDVAKMLVSDWLTDQRVRDPGSIISLSNGSETKPVVTNNFTSGLTDLDNVKIVERQKLAISEFLDGPNGDTYAVYFQKLKQEQRFAFRREIDALLLRARQFNFTQFKNRLYSDGKLTDAEKAHLNIVGRILDMRIRKYADSRDILMDILGAKK
jgi:hypothetical protein